MHKHESPNPPFPFVSSPSNPRAFSRKETTPLHPKKFNPLALIHPNHCSQQSHIPFPSQSPLPMHTLKSLRLAFSNTLPHNPPPFPPLSLLSSHKAVSQVFEAACFCKRNALSFERVLEFLFGWSMPRKKGGMFRTGVWGVRRNKSHIYPFSHKVLKLWEKRCDFNGLGLFWGWVCMGWEEWNEE